MNFINISLMVSLLLVTLNIQQAVARDFRSIIRIPIAPKNVVLDSNIQKELFRPVKSALIEKSIRDIVNSWNKNDFSKYLADTFQDKNLLIHAIRRSAPNDANLRLLSIQGISTLKQTWSKNKNTKKKQLNSVVIATVEIQIEFNDPFKGFIRLPHTSQFYLQVTESE